MSWYIKALKNYFTFSGRARRKEYWMFVLFYIIFAIVAGVVDALLGTQGIVSAIYLLAMIIPSISAAVRRLHDTNRSGWWFLIGLVPLIGIILLVFLVQDSRDEDNRFGETPKLATT